MRINNKDTHAQDQHQQDYARQEIEERKTPSPHVYVLRSANFSKRAVLLEPEMLQPYVKEG